MPQTPILGFERVSKRFGATVAVDDVSVDIAHGEFFALLGPSGCGKTTLMRMAAGFERPDEGRVLIDGADATDVPPHRRPVNMMFQSYALFPHMSVADNIAFGLKAAGIGRDDISARVSEMLRLVQLQGLEKRKPHQLSGGQKQRTALARALARGTKLLLLDEPLGALDRKLREETQFELMDIQVSLGTTFIVVTHDQEEAMTMADRIAVMNKGHIVQVGTPGDIYEQPKTRFIAEFVGDVNILEGKVTKQSEDGLWHISSPACRADLVIDDPDEVLNEGQAVAIAIRPEKMTISREPLPEGTMNALAGEIWDVGYLGDWTVYRVKLDSGEIIRVSRANVARVVEQPFEWEDRAYLTFAPSAAVILSQ